MKFRLDITLQAEYDHDVRHADKNGANVYLIQYSYDQVDLDDMMEAVDKLEQNELTTQVASPFTLVVVSKS